jgi:alpha-tubulin suppressor-like RCC1 family protein
MSTNALGARNQSDCRVTVFQVWGVGNNLWGQLGAGFVLSDTLLVNTNPIEVANDVGNPSRGLNNEQVLSVSAGYSHTLFLTTERQLWASGQNIYGQLGKPPLAASGCTLADESDLVCLQDPQVDVFPSSRNSVAAQSRLD